MPDYGLKPAYAVRRGDLISVDGNWLEVIRVNPTNEPEASEGTRRLQFLFLNGRSMIVRSTDEVLVR